MFLRSYFTILLSVFLLVACRNRKDLSEVKTEMPEYFPLREGLFLEYDVYSRFYGTGTVQDSNYSLKTILEDTFTDLEGGTTFNMFRYKSSDRREYRLDSVWNCKKRSGKQIIITENNLPFLKLNYPLLEGSTWNGNSFNSNQAETYTVVNVGKPWENYQKTVTVIQRNDSTLLGRDLRMEVYAEGIGLVYKLVRRLRFSSNGDDFGKGIIVEGTITRQKLYRYGNQ